jgi:hypothetical protein
MTKRACCMAVAVLAGIASPYGGDSNAQEHAAAISRMPTPAPAALVVDDQWYGTEWEYNGELLEPALRDTQWRARNPAGRLVLPAPRTSRAPAF